MINNIKCPNCGHEFEPNDAIRDQVKKELNSKAEEWKKEKDEEFKKKEAAYAKQLSEKDHELAQKLAAEKEAITKKLKDQLQQSIAADYNNQITMLQQSVAENKNKLEESRKKELEFLQKEQLLKNKEAEMEITIQKKMLEERELLKTQLQKEEQEKNNLKEQEFQLRTRELEKQIEDQKKLVDEMKRKAEQGSMQLQGEVQELILEELLRNTFPFDKVQEVGKGVRGADCIQTVRNQFGIETGKIIYESKRTKDFSNEWIEKLKADMRTLGADVAIIVTQTLPKDMQQFGEKDGVYICTYIEVRSVALLLRNTILKLFDAKKSQENKGDKMVMLYDYLTNNEFNEQWKAIREGFMSMKLSIQRERDAMEKLWKAREKQLEKVLLNAAHIRGSIEGIAGSDAVNMNLLEDENHSLLED